MPEYAEADTIAKFLERSKGELAKALPKWITPDRMMRIALTEFRKTPKLLECTPQSQLASVMQCAQLGLEPGSGLGHAWLVPFFNTKAGVLECIMIIGYRGMIDLAIRSSHVSTVSAEVVYEKDDFDYAFGTSQFLRHKPPLDVDRGKPLYAFCLAFMRDGTPQFTVMSAKEIGVIRDSSLKKAKGFSPWKTNEMEMWKKTTVRRLFKYLPASVMPREAHDALHREDKVFDTTGRIVEETEANTDNLKQRMAAAEGKPEPECHDHNLTLHEMRDGPDSTTVPWVGCPTCNRWEEQPHAQAPQDEEPERPDWWTDPNEENLDRI